MNYDKISVEQFNEIGNELIDWYDQNKPRYDEYERICEKTTDINERERLLNEYNETVTTPIPFEPNRMRLTKVYSRTNHIHQLLRNGPVRDQHKRWLVRVWAANALGFPAELQHMANDLSHMRSLAAAYRSMKAHESEDASNEAGLLDKAA